MHQSKSTLTPPHLGTQGVHFNWCIKENSCSCIGGARATSKFEGPKILHSLLKSNLGKWERYQVSMQRLSTLGVLKHAKKFLPQNILKNLYISIIEPHFRYCSSVWGCCSTTYINRLQKLQNRAVRMITNSAFDTPAKPLLANLGLRSISELNENELKLITYKSLNDLAPNYLR